MTMNVGTKLLAAGALILALSMAACKRDAPTPPAVPQYGDVFVDNMIRSLQDGNPQARFGAAHALSCLKGSVAQKAIPALRCALHDAHPLVRKEAARALRKLDPVAGEGSTL
jgi:HEAT repeat protein